MTSPIPRRDDAIYGDDDKIIGDMSRIQQRLADRIDKIRGTTNTAGLDPNLAEILHSHMQDTQTHLTKGSDIAQVNLDQARSRMDLANEHGSRVRGLNTSIGTPGLGGGAFMRPGGAGSTPRTGRGPIPAGPSYGSTPSAAPQQPAATHTSAGGSSPATPAPSAPQPSPQLNNRVPATAMRNGAYVPPVPAPMPDNYAANLNARTDQARQQALNDQRERARAVQQQQLQAQQAQREQARQAREEAREKELEKRQQARQLEREQAMEEMEREQEERQREHEEKRAKAEKNEKLQEVIKEWRNEFSKMDLDHQDEVLDKGSDAVSREEAVAIIEEALGDYYDEQDAADAAAGGIDATEADGGAYSGGGGLAPAASVGMDESEVSFDNVNMGAMDDETIHAYIEDALDLNGWTTDPTIRQQIHNLMIGVAHHESGGDPNAANGWDSNAIGPMQYDGYPYQSSRGTWQTIPQTFAAYHVEGTSNSIYDPQASAAAALAYMMDKYGMDPQTGAGIQEFASARGIDVNSGESGGGYFGY